MVGDAEAMWAEAPAGKKGLSEDGGKGGQPKDMDCCAQAMSPWFAELDCPGH